MRFFILIFVAIPFATPLFAGSLTACLPRFDQAASEAGIARNVIDRVLPTLEWQERVIELDRRQPEFVQTFAQYFTARVTERRIETGRKLYREHKPLLDRLTRKYGVPGQYLVAFWGLETNFGSYLGKMPTLDSLATLACDERRSRFFTGELINALKLIERESLEPGQMLGSWAGAVGHTQFMPSSYLRYAVDGDSDGHIDLWNSVPDALSSGANFLSDLGWVRNFRWGREVILPADFDFSVALDNPTRSLAEWSGMGIRQSNGRELPRAQLEARFILPAGHTGPAFLTYKNFDVIMGWNRSEYYALAVGHLADRINGAGRLRVLPPADQKSLDRQRVKEIQARLNALGHGSGSADGIFGPATRKALAAFERAAGLVADGHPDNKTVQALLGSTHEMSDDG